jgi:DegV family protein with EDD domain
MSIHGRVALVTDSTAYLPEDLLAGTNIDVVPVQVIVSGRAMDETSDSISTQRVAEALRAWQPVTTSRPTPERFRQAFAKAAVEGATGVVCATLSSKMSATFESAWLAAREVGIDVRVVDSQTVAMGLGFAVLAGERCARQGASIDEVESLVRRKAHAATAMFYVNTLEYLRRSGRVGAARAVVGQALKVKPLLAVRGGEVVPLEKVRTSTKAIARMADLAAAAVHGPVEVAVQHLDAQERASSLAGELHLRLPGTTIVQCPIGAVVAAHTGPGIVAVVVSPLLDCD